MAFNAATIWDVRATGNSPAGSDSNGGGFCPALVISNGATDLAVTNANTSSPVVTSASYAFITRDENHWLYIGAGTNFIPGLYLIVSTSGGAATLNAAIGAAYLINGGVPYSLNTTAGCATTASPTGGTWSVDYSQGTPISWTDIVIDGTTNTDMTSAGKAFGKNFIGNVLNVTSGTGFTVQRVQIISIPSGAVARVDKSLGTLSSTGGNATGGGPLATPGLAGSLKIGKNPVFIQSASYTCSSSSNVAGGRITDATTGTGDTPNYWIGWNTVRTINNIDSSRPLLKATANSMTILTLSGTSILTRNIRVGRNASETSVTGISNTGTHCIVDNCSATSIATGFSENGINTVVLNCFADTCTTGFQASSSSSVRYIFCVASACTTTGFNSGNYSASFEFCIACNGTGSADGFGTTANGGVFLNCIAYGNAGDGWQLGGAAGFQAHLLINCVGVGNGAYQFNQVNASDTYHRLINCAGKADGSGTDNLNASQKFGFITLTTNPFTDGANGNFSLNSNSDGGQLLYGTSYPGTFPGISSTGYLDVNAVQHKTIPTIVGVIKNLTWDYMDR